MSNPKNNNMLIKLIILGAMVAIVVIYFNSDMRKRMQNATNNVISKTNEQEKSLPLPPTKDEVSKLVTENIQHFAISVNQKDMSLFYKSISTFWQNKTTIKDLNKVFEPFINAGINLTVLKNMKPILDQGPQVLKNGDLHVTGHYNTTPSVLYFKQTYYPEVSGEWKLAEFFVEIKKK